MIGRFCLNLMRFANRVGGVSRGEQDSEFLRLLTLSITDRRRPEVRVLFATKIVSDSNHRPAPCYQRKSNDREYYNPDGRDPAQHSSDRPAGFASVFIRGE